MPLLFENSEDTDHLANQDPHFSIQPTSSEGSGGVQWLRWRVFDLRLRDLCLVPRCVSEISKGMRHHHQFIKGYIQMRSC